MMNDEGWREDVGGEEVVLGMVVVGNFLWGLWCEYLLLFYFQIVKNTLLHSNWCTGPA